MFQLADRGGGWSQNIATIFYLFHFTISQFYLHTSRGMLHSLTTGQRSGHPQSGHEVHTRCQAGISIRRRYIWIRLCVMYMITDYTPIARTCMPVYCVCVCYLLYTVPVCGLLLGAWSELQQLTAAQPGTLLILQPSIQHPTKSIHRAELQCPESFEFCFREVSWKSR